jgi:hypothetical protein
MFTSTAAGGGNDVAFGLGANKWVAVGRGNCNWLYSTDDGKTFLGSGTAAPCSAASGNCHAFFLAAYGVAWSQANSRFVGVGQYSTASIVTSTDGITCTGRTAATGTSTLYGIGYSPTQNRWIAAGDGTVSTFSLQYSTDSGVTWTGVVGSAAIGNPCYGIAWSETQQRWTAACVRIGGGGANLLTSTTGTSFTSISNANGGWIFSVKGMGIHFGGFVGWIATGQGSANTMGRSLNGLVFTGTGKTIFTEIGTSVVYSVEKARWVAVGNGGIAISDDGINWILTFSPLQNPWNAGANAIGSYPTYSGVDARYCTNTTIL